MSLVAVLIAFIVFPVVARRTAPVSQPVAFNHVKHVEDLGLACEFCHKYVRTSPHAGLPNAEVCTICHSVTQGESAEAEKVHTLVTSGDPLEFNKLFRLPSHVFFTHRRHVGVADLECESCHGGIAETQRPPERPLVTVTMNFCLDCHRERQQTLDCTSCHR